MRKEKYTVFFKDNTKEIISVSGLLEVAVTSMNLKRYMGHNMEIDYIVDERGKKFKAEVPKIYEIK